MPDRPLNPHLFLGSMLEHRAILPAIHRLFDQHELNLLGGTLSMVLGNLVDANAAERFMRATHGPEDIKVFVYYSRDRNFYAVKRAACRERDCAGKRRYRLNHWAREKVCAVMDRLTEREMIEHRMGHHPLDGEVKGRRSTARASADLEKIIVEATCLRSDCVARYFAYREKGGEVIILKDSMKRFQNYTDDCDTKQMRTNLELINAVNEKHIFALDLTDFIKEREEKPGAGSGLFISNTLFRDSERGCETTLTALSLDPLYPNRRASLRLDTRLVRIFNNSSFSMGGRFYSSSVQGISGDLRRLITIDGAATVELDYSGMHLRMLYALEGIQYDGDPYIVMGRPELRPFTKLLFLICINSKGRISAKRAFEKRLREKGVMLPANIATDGLITCFERTHSLLLCHFYSDRGLIAQNIDSQIAEQVMLEFARLGKPLACIHDSFLVKIDDRELLEGAMIDSYRSIMGGFKPVIKGPTQKEHPE